MAARRQVTNRLRTAYQKASKADKGRILAEVVNTTGMGRSTARRMLTGPRLPDPARQADRRRCKSRRYGDDTRILLEHVWRLMGMPCGKYLTVMLDTWLPLLQTAGDLDLPCATPQALSELRAMSPATADRYLRPARQAMALHGLTTTKPSPLLRNSIGLRKAGDEPPEGPGVVEADTVAHCGPTLKGEFARTLSMTDLFTGWTEQASIRNNASKWIIQAVEQLVAAFPFPITCFDSDNGSEFINHQVAAWLQARDIDQTRSRPYRKNDQATVESKNNHVVRRHAFYYRYDTPEELDLLNQMWTLTGLRNNFFTPTRKPTGYDQTGDGRRKRLYDKPRTPWQRVKDSHVLTPDQEAAAGARVAGINPADLTRQITAIQNQLIELARDKTQALADARRLDLAGLTPSIQRLTTTK